MAEEAMLWLGTDAALAAEAVPAIDEILSARLLVVGPTRAPKLAGSFRPAELPQVRLRGSSQTLTPEAIEALAIYLARSGHACEHPALDDVRAACEPRDLAELAWTLARSWELGGAKPRETWMIDSLLALASQDEDVVRSIFPTLKKDRALEVLGSIGTDAAAIELLGATKRGHKTWLAQGSTPLRSGGPATFAMLGALRTAEHLAFFGAV